jgi:5-formyltetrahydrofolate cyclo-ligase
MTPNKETFRKECLIKLKNSTKHDRLYKTALVNKKLLQQLKGKKRQKILFYYPLGLEVDLTKVLREIRRKNDVYIPFMLEQSFKMVPFRLPLKQKKFGIYEAGNTNRNIRKIDIAIVPVVGVDGNLQRIGFGKGMYDRFFEKLPKRPYTIFTQLELCQTKEFICDDYDIAGDILLTPKKVIINKNIRKR